MAIYFIIRKVKIISLIAFKSKTKHF